MAPPGRPDRGAEEAELEQSRAPFMEHLHELRARLWKAFLGVFVAAVVCYVFRESIYAFLTRPLFEVLGARGLEQSVKFRTIQGAFMFHFDSSLLGGLFFGIPVVMYQAWQFIAPGLYARERRLVTPFVIASSLCFLGGGAFGYWYALPGTFDFLIGYAIQDSGQQMLPDITVEDYLGFTTKLLLSFAIAFELPVGVSLLAAVGVLTHRPLIKFWRYAIVGAFILAAVLTPPDWVSQVMLAIPLCLLYALSAGLAYLITKRREAAAPPDPDPEGG